VEITTGIRKESLRLLDSIQYCYVECCSYFADIIYYKSLGKDKEVRTSALRAQAALFNLVLQSCQLLKAKRNEALKIRDFLWKKQGRLSLKELWEKFNEYCSILHTGGLIDMFYRARIQEI
ncbi:MAG: hypothetical protein J7J91_06895, partial [Deltaproteobacteria bacterium]|nr:hypothetical protein [Deltaproteobacteria bacterium]